MSTLSELIRARAALPDIETALSCGESPDDIEVIQELEGALPASRRCRPGGV
jgi:hypothetical protein